MPRGALVAASLAAPAMRHLFADSGFAGRLVDWARDTVHTTLEIVPAASPAVAPAQRQARRTFNWT